MCLVFSPRTKRGGFWKTVVMEVGYGRKEVRKRGEFLESLNFKRVWCVERMKMKTNERCVFLCMVMGDPWEIRGIF